MAAHALTIMRQCLLVARDEEKPIKAVTDFVTSALFAPGTCCSVGFALGSWVAVDNANDRLTLAMNNVVDKVYCRAELVSALEAAAASHAWMEAYPSMDAIREAIRLYVRIGTPYFKARWARFDAGDAETHLKARALITPTYGERRAPELPWAGFSTSQNG